MTEKRIRNILTSIAQYGPTSDHVPSRAVYEEFLKNPSKLPKSVPVEVVIICLPCEGLGDIIYGIKIKQYIKDWYNIDATIATTTPELFEKVGYIGNIITLRVASGEKHCRQVKDLIADIVGYDLILFAPMALGTYIYHPDIKRAIPQSTLSNTFFFSEYNDSIGMFDINAGIGTEGFDNIKRDGLLFTETNCVKSDILKFLLSREYAFAYIGQSVEESDVCILNFSKLITLKYPNLDQIVCPSWVEKISPSTIKHYLKTIDNIHIMTSSGVKIIKEKKDGSGRTLTFRCDILPVKNHVMLSLIKYSVKDVLLTGDQSLTDALSCCPDKNIFYQIAPWKEEFGKNLAKYLPNEFLNSRDTSCGTRAAINYTSDYSKFVSEWDFRKLGKPKVDAMIASALFIKQNKVVQSILKIINENGPGEDTIRKIWKITKSYRE